MRHQSLSWLVLFSWKEGGFLYPVSEAFLYLRESCVNEGWIIICA